MRERPTADDVLAKATALAGSNDFGPDGFEEGLERTLAAFAKLPLKPVVLEAAHAKLAQDLATRCRIEQWYKRNPNIEQLDIEGPILVCGLPRTGTTATVGILALDPRVRFLRAWEAGAPVPPPIAGQEDTDERAITARRAATAYDKASMHIHDPDGPEEDLAMLAGLNIHAYHGAFPMPEDFIDWWIDEDFGSTYRYHRRVLKLLQSRRPPNLWLLKAPPHLFKLEAFAARYTRAKFIMTHRSPLKVIPSVASLQYHMQSERCVPGALCKQERAVHLLRFWERGMARGLAARAKIGEDRFFDIRNDDVVGKPIEVFEQLYNWLGWDLDVALRGRMDDYANRHAPGAFGGHHYTLEEFGLSADRVRSSFTDYMDRFGLQVDGS
jgi:hypothetical protein